jgi:hypothetical protein
MFHLLDDTYRPIGHPESPPRPPAYPGRVKSFVYGCALAADADEVERVKAMMGGSISRRMGGVA